MPTAALITLSPLAAVLVVVATMAAVVVATMVVENWRNVVQRLPRQGSEPPAPVGEHLEAYRHGTTPVTEPATPLPPGSQPQGALTVGDGAVLIRDRPTADVLAALLLAGHATRRVSGSDRASAWVTPAATPPGADADRLAAGSDLRGRPARVDELLDHDEGGVVWITLQPSIDIGRAVRRAPVRQPVLAGLVTWWERSCASPAELSAEEVVAVRDAVAVVRGRIDLTPWAEPVARLHAALSAAAAAAAPLCVAVGRVEPDAGAGTAAAQPSAGRSGSS